MRFEVVEEGEEAGTGVREGGDEEGRVKGWVAEHFVGCARIGVSTTVAEDGGKLREDSAEVGNARNHLDKNSCTAPTISCFSSTPERQHSLANEAHIMAGASSTPASE